MITIESEAANIEIITGKIFWLKQTRYPANRYYYGPYKTSEYMIKKYGILNEHQSAVFQLLSKTLLYRLLNQYSIISTNYYDRYYTSVVFTSCVTKFSIVFDFKYSYRLLINEIYLPHIPTLSIRMIDPDNKIVSSTELGPISKTFEESRIERLKRLLKIYTR